MTATGSLEPSCQGRPRGGGKLVPYASVVNGGHQWRAARAEGLDELQPSHWFLVAILQS